MTIDSGLEKHFITLGVLGGAPSIEIDDARFQTLASSRAVLIAALALEEKYEFVLSNYLTLENCVLTSLASELVRNSIDYQDFYAMNLQFNICMVNLLTVSRLYVDRMPTHACDCDFGGTETLEKANGLVKERYQKSLAFRFMSALRNHVQHHSAPVHGVSSGGSWTDKPPGGMLEYSLGMYANKSVLAESKFKSSVLQECPEKIDLLLMTRSYVEDLSEIQADARTLVKSSVDKARKSIEAAHEELRELSDQEKLVGIEVQTRGDTIKRFPILLDWDDVRISLQARNGRLKNLSRRYVIGRSAMKGA